MCEFGLGVANRDYYRCLIFCPGVARKPREALARHKLGSPSDVCVCPSSPAADRSYCLLKAVGELRRNISSFLSKTHSLPDNSAAWASKPSKLPVHPKSVAEGAQPVSSADARA